MDLELKQDERIFAYGAASLMLAFIFGPFGLFAGLWTRNLAMETADGWQSAPPPDEFNPQLVKIGYWLSVAGIVIGGAYTALVVTVVLFASAGVSFSFSF